MINDSPAGRRSARGRAGAPTISDVARLAGVSPMTVSRVINGGENVRATTRDAVKAAIATLDYAPNNAARSLAGAARCRIALLYANPSAAYLSELLVGSLMQASRRDAQLIVERCDPSPHEARVVERLVRHGTDAMLLPPPLCDSSAILRVLRVADVPAVRIGTDAPAADGFAVTIDEAAAARQMTQHLIDIGHRRIGFVLGDPGQTASAARLNGYRGALADAGVLFDSCLVVPGTFGYRSGLAAADILLDLADPPTAIFASNDEMAAAVVAVAHRRGLVVPDDLSVCGFDDTAIATTIWPELTTIRQPISEMAQAAVDMLVSAVKKQRLAKPVVGEHRLLPYALIRRGSDAPPRAA